MRQDEVANGGRLKLDLFAQILILHLGLKIIERGLMRFFAHISPLGLERHLQSSRRGFNPTGEPVAETIDGLFEGYQSVHGWVKNERRIHEEISRTDRAKRTALMARFTLNRRQRPALTESAGHSRNDRTSGAVDSRAAGVAGDRYWAPP